MSVCDCEREEGERREVAMCDLTLVNGLVLWAERYNGSESSIKSSRVALLDIGYVKVLRLVMLLSQRRTRGDSVRG